METMSSSIEPVVPRTANLLACKQWWRVCFLYGDQQKYYRQVYGKAAAQRLALSNPTTKDTKRNDNTSSATATEISSTDRDYDIITDFIEAQLGDSQDFLNDNNETSHVTVEQQQPQQQQQHQQQQTVALFPAKYQSTSSNTASMTMRKSKKLLRSLKKHGHNNSNKSQKRKEKSQQQQENEGEATKPKTRVTMLDDPFLFGIDEDHLGDLIRPKQYAISATEDISKYFNYCIEQPQTDEQLDNVEKPALPPKKKPRPPAKEPDLNLNEQDIEFLNKSLQTRNLFRQKKQETETHDISFTFNEEPSLEATETNDNEQINLHNVETEQNEIFQVNNLTDDE